jgi:prepilin-type N-terminal cleavage/methylation domain-containing protein
MPQPSHGLTLLELVVVMAILAGLAGILVPLLPNLLRRAHKATDCTQSSELAKALQMYQASYYSYPDNFDLLTDGSNFPNYLPGLTSTDTTGTTPFGGFVKTGSLSSDEVGYLHNAGINNVEPLASSTYATTAATTPNSPFHPTRFPYANPLASNSQPISTTTTFAVLQSPSTIATLAPDSHLLEAQFAADATAGDATAKYIVFGVGPGSAMVGTIIQDAPMSVPQKKDFTPDNTYSHFGVIFKVDGLEIQRTERARFICAVALEDDELEATEKDAEGYYEVSRVPGQ